MRNMTGGQTMARRNASVRGHGNPRPTDARRSVRAIKVKRACIMGTALAMAGILGVLMTGRGHATPDAVVDPAPPAPEAVLPVPDTASEQPMPQAHPRLEWASSLRLASMQGLLLSGGSHWQTLTVRPGDTLSALFARADLPATDWIALLQLGGKIDVLRNLHPGDTLRYSRTVDGHLAALDYKFSPVQVLHVERSAQGFSYSVARDPTTVRIIRVAGMIRHSLLAAVRRAGVDYGTATNLGQIFHWRIDLSRAIHPGDHFVLVYRQVYAHGQLLHSGPVLAAELKTGKRTLTAFRYTDGDGNTAYYDASGKTLRPSILRTPVDYTRVSSRFSRNRYNPVLHVWRPHYGVDLAAPTGTPIHAAANGHVKFIGRKGGYGRLVILDNFGSYSTRYGHMSRYAKGLHEGDFVHQGQVIGYVGESGVATGPHLHFEIRIDGKPKPPLKVDLPGGAPIPHRRIAAYKNAITPFLAALDTAPRSGRVLLAQAKTPAQDTGEPLTVASINTATEAALMHGHPRAGAGRHSG